MNANDAAGSKFRDLSAGIAILFFIIHIKMQMASFP
jgi:hypothetical protein